MFVVSLFGLPYARNSSRHRLENTDKDGELINDFVSTFGKYIEVEEITSEIVAEVLKEVRIYPDGRFEITWNFRDELKEPILDLQGE